MKMSIGVVGGPTTSPSTVTKIRHMTAKATNGTHSYNSRAFWLAVSGTRLTPCKTSTSPSHMDKRLILLTVDEPNGVRLRGVPPPDLSAYRDYDTLKTLVWMWRV